MECTKYRYHHLAKVTIEAVTPIAIGSGDKNIVTDSVVVTDMNGMPYLPGSSIAGLLRHAMGDEKQADFLFGFQKGNKGHGSMLSVTDAVMIGKEGIALDGLQIQPLKDVFYLDFQHMPIRQHVRINEKGSAEKNGKYDGQVAFKGTRFVFEMELCSEKSMEDEFNNMLDSLSAPEFRVGSGTRSGYGHIRVVSIKTAELDLCDGPQLEQYLQKSTCLSDSWERYAKKDLSVLEDNTSWEHFHVPLKAEDFFLFGSGLSDDVADITPVREKFIVWNDDNHPHFEAGTLIPGTSIKGALLHRTAFYWNKLNDKYADDGNGKIADENPAVVAIYGTAANAEDNIKRGNLIIDDIIIPETNTKILNHVSIDRFTGGALDGALFTERVSDGRNVIFDVNIYVNKDAFKVDSTVRKAFCLALDDLRDGMLPLGGGTNRGNGIFTERNK